MHEHIHKNMKEKVRESQFPQKRPISRTARCLEPISNIEEHVQADWWRRVFNSTYLKTDADVVEDQSITRREVDIFSKILNLSPEDKILDLCCGQGRHSLELARRGFNNVEGLDRSHFLIRKAKTQAKNEGLFIKFREGDAPQRLECSTEKALWTIIRYLEQVSIDWAASYYKTTEGQKTLSQRSSIVEWVIAEAKCFHGLRRAICRGLEKMKIQTLMIATVQNLKRLIKIISPQVRDSSNKTKQIFDILIFKTNTCSNYFGNRLFFIQIGNNTFLITCKGIAIGEVQGLALNKTVLQSLEK